MIATALLAALSGALQIVALDRRRLWFPFTALALYGFSAVLFWWAVAVTRGKLAACGQGCVSSAVVREGPYRYVRHPFYVAYDLTWLAGFAATGWWPLGISMVLMARLYDWFAREEEEGLLASSLATEYAEYRKLTGRYWPQVKAG